MHETYGLNNPVEDVQAGLEISADLPWVSRLKQKNNEMKLYMWIISQHMHELLTCVSKYRIMVYTTHYTLLSKANIVYIIQYCQCDWLASLVGQLESPDKLIIRLRFFFFTYHVTEVLDFYSFYLLWLLLLLSSYQVVETNALQVRFLKWGEKLAMHRTTTHHRSSNRGSTASSLAGGVI